MSNPAMDYLLGKVSVDKALSFEEVGQCRFSSLLEGYVITIEEKDYFIASIPKEDNVVSVSLVKVVEPKLDETGL